jgi:hypothetical protein
VDFREKVSAAFPDVVSEKDLLHPRASLLAARLLDPRYPAGELLECRRSLDGRSEVVVADMRVELGQRSLLNDVRSTEPVAIVISSDDALPAVLSLRTDFPDVSHCNLSAPGEPKSLCLYDTTWDDIAPSWTAKTFLERIRWWFSATAYEELHGDQQPLEPLMFTGGRLVVGDDILARQGQVGVVLGGAVYRSEDGSTLFLRAGEDARVRSLATENWAVAVVTGPVQQHGRITAAPKTLGDLLHLIGSMGADLAAAIEGLIASTIDSAPTELQRHLFVLVTFPVQRTSGAAAEEAQSFAFLVSNTLGEIGVDIGYLSEVGRDNDIPKYGVMLKDSRVFTGALPVGVLEVYREFSGAVAQHASGLSSVPSKVLLIGAGALGSQLVNNLARTGVTGWDVVDEDVLLPHNLARHALNAFAVGIGKAKGMVGHLSSLLHEAPGRGIVANFLRQGEAAEEIEEAISEASLILDASASVSVGRALAFRSHSARGVTMFLNPKANDLVCLYEDKRRLQNLAVLEHYYLRAVMEMSQLDGHLSQPATAGYRYSASCRHPSVQVLGSHVATLAGCGATYLLHPEVPATAAAKVWRLNESTGGVAVIDIPVGSGTVGQFDDWKVHLLDCAFDDMKRLREARLPNETGGVLIGSVDRVNRSVFVVAALPAPADSEEKATSFIRGVAWLRQRVSEISTRTLGQLEYVGEWHSHPRGFGLGASGDDRKLYSWVHEELSDSEAPPIMAIAGDDLVRIHAAVRGMELQSQDYRRS